MSYLKPSASESRETLLPMPVLASDARHAAPLPVYLHDVSPGRYALLPAAAADAYDAVSEDGTLAGDDDAPKPRPADLESVQFQVEVPAPHVSFSWYRALASTLWYMRMCLLLVILSSAVTLGTGTLFAVVGNLAFLGMGAREPYAAMLARGGGAEAGACVVGAGVLGCVVGVGAFVGLVVRRARMTVRERAAADSGTTIRTSAGGRVELEPRTDEPEELWGALGVAALAGVFAMAVGMAVVPGLRHAVGEGEEEGFEFGVRHALAVGAWGLGAPLVPMGVCMVVTTLWRCDPCAGAECCCEGVAACCERN